MRIALVLSLVLAVLAVVFALQNPAYIDVNLGPFLINGSTALILMVTFCIGVVVGILATTPSLIRRKRRIKQLEKGTTEPAADWSTREASIDTSTPRSYPTE